MGEVGTLLWMVNAVKAQNHTKQEGAPPSADPGGVGGFCLVVTSFFARLYSFSHTTQLYRHVLQDSCCYWRTRIGLAITTTFDNDSGARRHILGILYPLPSIR